VLTQILRKSHNNQFDDQFFILQELKYIFFALSVANAANLIMFIGTTALWKYSVAYTIVLPCFGFQVIWGSQWAACVISTKWVTSKVQHILECNEYEVVRKKITFGMEESMSSVQFLQLHHNTHASGPSSSVSTSGGYTSTKNKEMFCKLLSKAQGFAAFATHLSMEFSMETLLFLIEISQYQVYIRNHCKYNMVPESPMPSLYEKLTFPLDVPQSEIVFADDYKMYDDETEEKDVAGDDSDDEAENNALLYAFKVKAIQLYRKYIKSQCELEVNISYHAKKQLSRLMEGDENINRWLANKENPELQFKQLIDLYEQACHEIFTLVIDSFNRFKHTAKFNQLRQYKIFV